MKRSFSSPHFCPPWVSVRGGSCRAIANIRGAGVPRRLVMLFAECGGFHPNDAALVSPAGNVEFVLRLWARLRPITFPDSRQARSSRSWSTLGWPAMAITLNTLPALPSLRSSGVRPGPIHRRLPPRPLRGRFPLPAAQSLGKSDSRHGPESRPAKIEMGNASSDGSRRGRGLRRSRHRPSRPKAATVTPRPTSLRLPNGPGRTRSASHPAAHRLGPGDVVSHALAIDTPCDPLQPAPPRVVRRPASPRNHSSLRSSSIPEVH